jgi:hypothetical protein
MLDWLRACALSEDPLFLAVRDNETGAHLGMVSYLAILPLPASDLGRDAEVEIAPGIAGKVEQSDAMVAPALTVSISTWRDQPPRRSRSSAHHHPHLMAAWCRAGDVERHAASTRRQTHSIRRTQAD